MDSAQKIQELEARLAVLTGEVEVLRAGAGASTAAPASSVSTSRRNMLKLAGAAAAGTAAALAARGGTVAAADGDAVKASTTVSTTPTTQTPTVLEYTNAIAPKVTFSSNDVPANIFLVRDVPTSASTFNPDGSTTFPSAIAGYAFRTVNNGVYGYTQRPGYGVVGFGAVPGSIGLYAQGAKANVELKPAGDAPGGRTDSHNMGEVIMDTASNLWVCVAPGTPGTWRKLAGTATAGAFHPLAPSRVYDSRVPQPTLGAIANGVNRLISVAAKRDTVTGNIVTGSENLVPAGATAISVNVTVVNTVAGGFVTINPGGTTSVEGATVNWSASGQILNNGVIVKLNDSRQVTAVVGGTATTKTDLVLDVTGYFL